MVFSQPTDVTPAFGRVVLVASLGGVAAITTVLAGIPATYPVSIAVVQHRCRARSHDLLAPILARRTKLAIRVAETGSAADEPGITVVPGETTATIDDAGRWVLDDNTAGVWPGNALLISSACRGPTVAVILTGALGDGAEGCRAVKRAGGRVLVQDPRTARASSMPASAIATGCADFVLPLDRLASGLLALTTAPGAAELLKVPLPPWARLIC